MRGWCVCSTFGRGEGGEGEREGIKGRDEICALCRNYEQSALTLMHQAFKGPLNQ